MDLTAAQVDDGLRIIIDRAKQSWPPRLMHAGVVERLQRGQRATDEAAIGIEPPRLAERIEARKEGPVRFLLPGGQLGR